MYFVKKKLRKQWKKILINFIETKAILNNEQFLFRRGLVIFNALNSFNGEIYAPLDSKHFLLSISIDFTKAFDTVRHDILLTNYITMAYVASFTTGLKTTSTTELSPQKSITVNLHHVQLITGYPKAVCRVPFCFFYILMISPIYLKFSNLYFCWRVTAIYHWQKNQLIWFIKLILI